MKIGIITLPFNNNYGGLLQAYALQTYLKRRGHQVFSIHQSYEKLYDKVKNEIKHKLNLGLLCDNREMVRFQRVYFNQTFKVKNEKDLTKINDYCFDAIIVGSDQVWRFEYIKERYGQYFLNFVKLETTKKISFAASFGVDHIEVNENQLTEIKKLLSLFNAISVREISGVELCKNYLNQLNVINLLDPTLLFCSDFYKKLYNGSELDRKERIGIYLLDEKEEYFDLISRIENKTTFTKHVIGKQNRNTNKRNYEIYPSVNQWLKDFETSEFILTDSYHGVIFSIIFKKQFLVIGNQLRGMSRFVSLLNTLRLKDKLINIDEINDINLNLLFSPINYSYVDTIIELNLNNADKFLKLNSL